APSISAPAQVTSTRAYTASVPVRSGFTYRWEILNGTIAVGAESGVTANGVNTLTFTAGAAAPDNSPATMTLTCTETNASGDSSASGLFSAAVFPNPLAPAITVVKPGSTTAITAVSDGPGFVYVASLLPRAHMTYQWIAPPGMTGTTSGANGET